MDAEYSIILSDKFDKTFSQLDRVSQKRIVERLKSLSKHPKSGKPLEGRFKDIRSLRVGKYRILYNIQENHLINHIYSIFQQSWRHSTYNNWIQLTQMVYPNSSQDPDFHCFGILTVPFYIRVPTLNHLTPLCDELEAGLVQAQIEAGKLMEAVVHHVLSE